MSCPFYGLHRIENVQILVDQLGNECALLPAYAPCRMETEGHQPHLATCRLAQDHANLADQVRERYIVIERNTPGRWTLKEWEDRCRA